MTARVSSSGLTLMHAVLILRRRDVVPRRYGPRSCVVTSSAHAGVVIPRSWGHCVPFDAITLLRPRRGLALHPRSRRSHCRRPALLPHRRCCG